MIDEAIGASVPKARLGSKNLEDSVMRATAIGCVLWVSMVSALSAGERPAEAVLEMVPRDVAGVALAQDLSSLWDRFRGGPLWPKAKQTPMLRRWVESGGFARFQVQFETVFGEMEPFAKNVAGHCVAIAFNGPSKLENNAPLFMAWVKKPSDFMMFMDQLKEIQENSGELMNVNEKSVGESVYFERVSVDKKTNDQKTNYWFLVGNVFALSDSEEFIEQALKVQDGGLGADPRFKAAMASVPVDATARAYLNPRVFDAAMQAALTQRGPVAQRFLPRVIGSVWPAITSIVASMDVTDSARVHVKIAYDETKLSKPLQRLRDTSMTMPKLWSAMPSNPVAAMIGRIDVDALLDLLVLTAAPRERLQVAGVRQFLSNTIAGEGSDVFSQIGPDMAMALTCPNAGEGRKGFPRLTAVIPVGDGTDGSDALRTNIQASLDTLLDTVIQGQSSGGGAVAGIEEQTVGDITLKNLTPLPDWPDAITPGYAMCGANLVVSSNKDALAGAVKQLTAKKDTAGKLASVRRARCADAQAVLYVDVPQLRAILRSHRAWLIKQELAKGQKTAEQITMDQQNIGSMLQLVDTICVAKKIGKTRVDLTIDLVGAK